MSDATLLPDILRRESRCFLQYVHEAFPWAHGKGEPARATMLAAAAAEGAALAQLAKMLQRRHIMVPFFGAYPSAFTSYNYLSASSLLPKLIADQKRGLADLERDLPTVVDAEIREHLETYRDLKRKHIQELESL
jgi:hypothetical protein